MSLQSQDCFTSLFIFMITIHEEPIAVDHRDDFYRTERDICLYDMHRQYEDRDNESNY